LLTACSHKHAKLEKINTYGLLYTIKGTDPSLKPTILMAHQDVVPVADESTWTHPPFSGHFDGENLWGRGSSDDKNSLTALMSTVETMLADNDWKPRRTLMLSFGFDEECSGYRGAKEIAKVVTDRYGDDGIAVILDEGGMGVNDIEDVTYVVPSVMEKGHVDIWFELHVVGGHSSVPFPHTGIGIVSEIVTKLEANPYKPALTKENPVYSHMACMARYSPKKHPKITELVRNDDLQGIADELASMDLMSNFLVQTSQAVDFIAGGQKINAMPEVTTLGVNYRVAPQESIVDIQHNVVTYIQDIVEKYGLKVEAFKGDKDYEAHVAKANSGKTKAQNKPDYDIDWKGTLKIEAREVTQVAPVSPMEGGVWDTFSGTAQYTFGTGKNTVVPTGETMTGNTDTRHYLSKLTTYKQDPIYGVFNFPNVFK
jgi:Gly-Xaa carboxypeptidase